MTYLSRRVLAIALLVCAVAAPTRADVVYDYGLRSLYDPTSERDWTVVAATPGGHPQVAAGFELASVADIEALLADATGSAAVRLEGAYHVSTADFLSFLEWNAPAADRTASGTSRFAFASLAATLPGGQAETVVWLRYGHPTDSPSSDVWLFSLTTSRASGDDRRGDCDAEDSGRTCAIGAGLPLLEWRQVNPVPLPPPLTLLAAGLLGLVLIRRIPLRKPEGSAPPSGA